MDRIREGLVSTSGTLAKMSVTDRGGRLQPDG